MNAPTMAAAGIGDAFVYEVGEALLADAQEHAHLAVSGGAASDEIGTCTGLEIACSDVLPDYFDNLIGEHERVLTYTEEEK